MKKIKLLLKKLRPMLQILILIVLLLPTTANSTTQNDVVLNPGDVAKFRGVLVSESRYKEYSTALQVTDFYKNSQLVCEPQICEQKDSYESYFGTAGLVLGIIIGVVMAK